MMNEFEKLQNWFMYMNITSFFDLKYRTQIRINILSQLSDLNFNPHPNGKVESIH